MTDKIGGSITFGDPKKHEIELLLLASRSSMSEEDRSLMRTHLKARIDWGHLSGIARRNGVLSLMASNIFRYGSDLLTSAVTDSLDSELREHVQTNMLLTSNLIEVVNQMNSRSIPVIAFKGPTLALRAYGDISLRKFGDLDILVRPKHLACAVEALKAVGFVPLTSVNWITLHDLNVSDKKDIYLANANRTVNLELHWKLSGSHFALPVEMNRLWKDAETITLAGVAIKTLSFTDLFIYLCLHGSRHGWERLGWICDINQLINSTPDIDWDLIMDEAERIGCRKILGLSVYLVRELFGGEVPLSVSKKFSENEVQMFGELISEITERLFSQERNSMVMGNRYRYQLQLKERFIDRCKLHFHYLRRYARLGLTPNQADRDRLELPDSLRAVYFLTRPFRLLADLINKW